MGSEHCPTCGQLKHIAQPYKMALEAIAELQAENARLNARLEAAEKLIEALENEHSAFLDTLTHRFNQRDSLAKYDAAKEVVEAARVKLKAVVS